MKLAYVDSCVWITRIEGLESYRHPIENALQRLSVEGYTLCISDAERLEVLSRPGARGQDDLLAIYRKAFQKVRDLKSHTGVLQDALPIAHAEGLKPMDAVHVAIAQHHGCLRFVSTDPHFRRLKLLEPCWIDLGNSGSDRDGGAADSSDS